MDRWMIIILPTYPGENEILIESNDHFVFVFNYMSLKQQPFIVIDDGVWVKRYFD